MANVNIEKLQEMVRLCYHDCTGINCTVCPFFYVPPFDNQESFCMLREMRVKADKIHSYLNKLDSGKVSYADLVNFLYNE